MTNIQLTVPADPAFIGLVRTAAAHAAAHANLTMDQIDDLRLAVDEAFTLAIGTETKTGDVTTKFHIYADGLDIAITGPRGVAVPETGTFAWTILTALVNHVVAAQDDAGHLVLTLQTKAGASA